jgi:hypothetical protein
MEQRVVKKMNDLISLKTAPNNGHKLCKRESKTLTQICTLEQSIINQVYLLKRTELR